MRQLQDDLETLADDFDHRRRQLAELQSAPPPETMREGLTRKVQIAKYEQEIADLEKKISLLRGN